MMAELIFYNMYLVKRVWEGQKRRCAGAGRKKEWKKKSMTHRKKNYFHLYYASSFANTCSSIA